MKIRNRYSFDINNLIKRYNAGETVKEIADSFGCGYKPIFRRLRKAGVVLKGNRLSIDITELTRLYHIDEPVQAIAKHFNVARDVITRRLKEIGLPIRSGSEANLIRMAKLSDQERKQLTMQSHIAARGRHRSLEERCKMAATNEIRVKPTRIERKAGHMLFTQGIWDVIYQKAIGPYNIDIALTEFPIAVEIFGGSWHSSGTAAGRFRQRFDHIIDAGWIPVIVWVTRDYPFEIGAANYIVSLTQILRKGKSIRRGEHVIRGDGKPSGMGKDNLDYRACVGGDKTGDLIRGQDGRFYRDAVRV